MTLSMTKPIALWSESDWIAVIATLSLGAFVLLGLFIATRRDADFAGHPRGLFVLFYAEMWERFSFYGMRALLVLYLTRFWLFSDGRANLIYGAYNAMVYISPVLGGYLADRWLGQRKAVVFGCLVLALGHGFMTVEGLRGITDPALKQTDPAINVFWLALALIVVGSGFMKANISVIVGQLYRLTDRRRDGAYTIFYMGVNVGAALGTLLVGYLGETIGWSWGFGLAGVGMVVGLAIFTLGRPALAGQGEPPAPLSPSREWGLYGLGALSTALIWLLFQHDAAIQNLLILTGVVMLAYTLYEARKLDREPRQRIYAILFLIALNPVFWGLFEQAGGSLNLYTDHFVDRAGVPASLFQSINPIYIVLLGPVFAGGWQALAKRGLEPSTPTKFALALAQVGLGFLVFVWGARAVGPSAMTPVLFVFLIYLLHTTGELCLSPVGLSAMTRLAPAAMGSFIMGAWFYMTAVGQFVAGKIGEATGGTSGAMSQALTLTIYSRIGWITLGVALVVQLLSRLVTGWMHVETLADGPDSD